MTTLYGPGAPADGLGADGDWYAATDTRYLYGPKAAGAWPAGVLLSGATLTSVSDLRALVPSELADDQLATVIAREEAMLARQVTDLAGPRTQAWHIGDPATMGLWWDTRGVAPGGSGPLSYSSMWVMPDRRGPLGLLRPTDAVAVVDNGAPVADSDIRLLRQGTLVERAAGGWNGPLVEVTYTPNDALEVVRVVIELCRMTLTETGYQSEQIGDYRYAKHLRPAPGEADPRKALIRSLMTHLPKGTMRIRTQAEDDRIGAVGP